MSAVVSLPAPIDLSSIERLRVVRTHPTLAILELDPSPELPEDPPWGPRIVVCASNFRIVPPPTVRAKPFTARPRGSRDAPEWTRYATALARWFDGRTTAKELTRAIAYERSALLVSGPFAGFEKPSPRDRPTNQQSAPKPPIFTKDELKAASEMIEKKCKGPLIERAWYELRSPPKRCLPTNSFKMKVKRAIYRAERVLRNDACRFAWRGPEPKVAIDGRAPRLGSLTGQVMKTTSVKNSFFPIVAIWSVYK